ncbi:MAG: hypothetical protein IJJ70_06650 [Treponema sp.]|nr:hypothetical protein [Treponema sp.]
MKKSLFTALLTALSTMLLLGACGSTDGAAKSGSGASAKSSAKQISALDAPHGWASYAGTKDLAGKAVTPPDAKNGTKGGAGGTVYTVTNRAELFKAVNAEGPKVIYVQGKIEMSDTGRGTMIPETYNGTTPQLDKFIATKTAKSVLPCSSYAEWKQKYTASFNYDQDQFGEVAELRTTLQKSYEAAVVLRLKNDTTIIGLGNDAELRGVSFILKGVQNIVIRNLILSDCYNPFPKLEDSDGLNADLDLVSIQSSKYVWIDHCTFKQTFTNAEIQSDKYETKDRRDVFWRVYDGQCDITKASDFVTISWNHFSHGDKTMLVGNSDKNTSDINHQTITVDHNWYDGCKQRLPFVRFATIHLYNNLYTDQQGSGIDRRKDCRIYSEANSFEEAKRSVTPNRNGVLFDIGSLNIEPSAVDAKSEWKPSDYYKYSVDKAAKVKDIVTAGCGAGKLTVIQ